ncbi:MAG: rhodanese-like domain-containing protein [Bacteroidia bacterium]|nr:rhodanese-like domain-containing protein [Bacteroidia bacterium]
MLNRTLRSLCCQALALLSISACTAQDARTSSGAFNAMLKTLLAHTVPEQAVSGAPEPGQAVYLDARAYREFEVSHIPGAVWVGYDDFDLARVEGLDRSRPVVVYCSVGYRSEKVSEKLLAAGFTQVSNLYGGIFEWCNQGRPVVNAAGAPTEQVHAYNRKWGIWVSRGEKVYE